MSFQWPPNDSPLWKLLQSALSILGLLILVRHGLLHSAAHSGPDSTDAVGLALAGKFALEMFGFKRS